MSLEFSDFISTCKGETAIGNGSRLPLVISTSIKAYNLLIKRKYNKIDKINFYLYCFVSN